MAHLFDFFMKLQNRCCPQIPWSAMIKLSLVWRPGTNPLHHSLMIYFASPWICPCWSPNVFQGSWFGPCSPCVIKKKKKKKSALNKRGWVQDMAGHGSVGVMLNIFLLLDRVARRNPEVELSPIACCQRTGKWGRKQPGHSWANASHFHPFG